MDIRPVTPRYAVAPQFEPEALDELRQRGFTAVICNRPDEEVPEHLAAAAMRQAAEAAGLDFVLNPVRNGALTQDNVDRQAEALAAAGGPVLAYCRSGTRSTVVWALGAARHTLVDDILAAAASAGYALDGLRPQLEATAREG